MEGKFLQGKGVIITGGASGFGRGVALEYAKRGANIVLADINEELLEETSMNIKRETNQQVIPIVCDVSNSNQVKEMAEQAFKELDNVYILFNNAGTASVYGMDVIKLPEKDWDYAMNVNLKGQWLVDKFVCKQMRRQKLEPLRGKIIHTTSLAAVVIDEQSPVYSISKVGIIALTQILARTLAPHITSNAIAPGFHVTGIYGNREDIMVEVMKIGHVKTPLNRLGTIEDVVNLMIFLASPSSDFITGHVFPIDGGIGEVGVPPYTLKSDI